MIPARRVGGRSSKRREGCCCATCAAGASTSLLVYPLVVGQSVNLHPVAILLALTAGTVVAGIVGALLAIPVAGVIWTIACYLRDKPPRETAAAVSTAG